jgi:acyl transferase domain-containing protein
VEAISEVPKNRWDIDAYYDPNPDAPGKMYTRSGGFVEQFDEFDPNFLDFLSEKPTT